MAVNTPNNPLLVFEYGGTARSGKGTIVRHVSEQYTNVAAEETGADYRLVTRMLLNQNVLEPGMPEGVAGDRICRLKPGALVEMVASRPSFVAEHGLDNLYTGDVNQTVSSVSPIPMVRKAVKAGFMQRVAAVAANEKTDILLVDGRNLAPVVAKVPGTKLLMRTFVTCTNSEAAMREVARNGQIGDYDAFSAALKAITERNHKDATRLQDPVAPDIEAVDYWSDRHLHTHVAEIADLLYGGDRNRAWGESFQGFRAYTDVVRRGIGRLAARTERQVLFDTTHFRSELGRPPTRMLEAATLMFSEALSVHNRGSEHPVTAWPAVRVAAA